MSVIFNNKEDLLTIEGKTKPSQFLIFSTLFLFYLFITFTVGISYMVTRSEDLDVFLDFLISPIGALWYFSIFYLILSRTFFRIKKIKISFYNDYLTILQEAIISKIEYKYINSVKYEYLNGGLTYRIHYLMNKEYFFTIKAKQEESFKINEVFFEKGLRPVRGIIAPVETVRVVR